MFAQLRSVRPPAQRSYDLAAWVFGYFSMAWLQTAVGYSTSAQLRPALITGVASGIAFVVLGVPLRVHEGRNRVGSFADVVANGLGESEKIMRAIYEELGLSFDLAGVVPVLKHSVSVPPEPQDWIRITSEATVAITGFGG